MLLTEPTLVRAFATTSPPGVRPSCESTSSGLAPEFGLDPNSEGVVNAGVEGWTTPVAGPAVTGDVGDARNSSDVNGTLWTCNGAAASDAVETAVPTGCAVVVRAGLIVTTVATSTPPATSAMRTKGAARADEPGPARARASRARSEIRLIDGVRAEGRNRVAMRPRPNSGGKNPKARLATEGLPSTPRRALRPQSAQCARGAAASSERDACGVSPTSLSTRRQGAPACSADSGPGAALRNLARAPPSAAATP